MVLYFSLNFRGLLKFNFFYHVNNTKICTLREGSILAVQKIPSIKGSSVVSTFDSSSNVDMEGDSLFGFLLVRFIVSFDNPILKFKGLCTFRLKFQLIF